MRPQLDAAAGIAPARDLELLAQGYRFLRRIEHRLRVVHDQPIHRLPEANDELDKLARRSGFPDGVCCSSTSSAGSTRSGPRTCG